MKARFCLSREAWELIYGEEVSREIARRTELDPEVITAEQAVAEPRLLAGTELLFSGWGGPKLDQELLTHMPDLKAVFYGAGSIRGMVTPAFWERGILITSAFMLNAVPVSEYTLAMILLALRNTWRQIQQVRERKTFERLPLAGSYHSIVGLVSLGVIGRQVAKRLESHDLTVYAYDPFVRSYKGVCMSSLEEIFALCHVVSIHTPWLKETEGLITEELMRSMRPGATLINTSRGAVIDEPALCRVLAERPDLSAVLDVTWPEPPEQDSPLYQLPNVVLTPHIAGSLGAECRRMGWGMAEELDRYLSKKPMRYTISRRRAERMA